MRLFTLIDIGITIRIGKVSVNWEYTSSGSGGEPGYSQPSAFRVRARLRIHHKRIMTLCVVGLWIGLELVEYEKAFLVFVFDAFAGITLVSRLLRPHKTIRRFIPAIRVDVTKHRLYRHLRPHKTIRRFIPSVQDEELKTTYRGSFMEAACSMVRG